MATWQRLKQNDLNLSKRIEMEADVGGAILCGKIGMSLQDFMNGTFGPGKVLDLQKSQPFVASGFTLQNGEKLTAEFVDIAVTLFQGEDHPTNRERYDQLMAVADVVGKEWSPASILYTQWMGAYAGMQQKLSAGLALSEPVTPKRAPLVTSMGRTLVRPKPSCLDFPQ